jgi:hypothetical protein
MKWRCSSSRSRMPALQVWSPEFKLQSIKKKKKEGENIQNTKHWHYSTSGKFHTWPHGIDVKMLVCQIFVPSGWMRTMCVRQTTFLFSLGPKNIWNIFQLFVCTLLVLEVEFSLTRASRTLYHWPVSPAWELICHVWSQLFCSWLSTFLSTVCWKDIFLHCVVLACLSKINWP